MFWVWLRAVIGAIGVATGLMATLVAGAAVEGARPPLEGRAPGHSDLVPAIEAAFERESYRPGERANLVIKHHSRNLTMQVFDPGPSVSRP